MKKSLIQMAPTSQLPNKLRCFCNRSGFSLMSLVIVIAVIAVLVIMAVPAFIGHIENARLSQIIHDGRLIQDAADRYYMSNQTVFWDPDSEGVSADSFIAEIDADGVVLSGSMEYLPEAFITEDGTEVSFQDIIDGLEGDETARFFDVNLSAISDYVNIRSNAGYFIMRNPTGQVLVSDPKDEVTQARVERFSSGESNLSAIEYSVVPESLEIVVTEGGTDTIEVTVADPAEGYTVEFESADDSIATVSSAGSVGTVTGVQIGETEVEVTISADGYNDATETITINVVFGMEYVDSCTEYSNIIYVLTFGFDGYLYGGNHINQIHKIDPSDMSHEATYAGNSHSIYALTFGSDDYLYSGSTISNGVHKIDSSNMSQVATYTEHDDAVRALAFDSDGYLYSGSSDNQVHKIDPSDMSHEATYTGHTSTVNALTFDSDGYLYSGSSDNQVHKIDPEGMSQVATTYTEHTNNVNALTFGDGYLYSASSDNQVHKIDPSNMSQAATYTGHTNRVQALTFGSDGFLYSGSSDNQVHKINPSNMSQLDTYTGHNGANQDLAFGSDGYLYSTSTDGEIHKIRVQ